MINLSISSQVYRNVSYDFAERLQQGVGREVGRKRIPVLLFFEFQGVITAGVGIKKGEIPTEIKQEISPDFSVKGVPIMRVRRGGRLTVHGPGQLVCFPIIPLERGNEKIRDILTLLEKWLRVWLRSIGIRSITRPHLTGIWIHSESPDCYKKIGSIGIGYKKGVTQHGISINIDIDPNLFSYIVPCGNSTDGIINIKDLSANPGGENISFQGAIKGLSSVFSHIYHKWLYRNHAKNLEKSKVCR